MEPTHRILLARIFQLFSNPRNKLYYLRVLNTCSFQCWPLLMWIPFGKGFHICSMDPPQKTTYIPQIFHQKDWVEPLPKGISTHIYIKPKKQTKCQKLPTRHWGVNHSTCLDPTPCPQLLCFSRPHGLLWPLLARGLKFSWHGSAPFVKRFMPALKNTLSHATPLTTAKTNIWWSDLMIADVKTGH